MKIIYHGFIYEYVEINVELKQIAKKIINKIFSEGLSEEFKKVNYQFTYKKEKYKITVKYNHSELYFSYNVTGSNEGNTIKIRLSGVNNILDDDETITKYVTYVENVIYHELIHIVNKKPKNFGIAKNDKEYYTHYLEQDSMIAPIAKKIADEYNKNKEIKIEELIKNHIDDPFFGQILKHYHGDKKLWNKFLKEIYKYVSI